MTNDYLEHYVKAINKIDDHFEYSNESLKDRAFIHKVLAELTESLSKTEGLGKTVRLDYEEMR